MKYLETNSLRKVASYLTNDSFISDKYTSILSLIELLSGFKDEKSFQLRRSIIKKIALSKIRTDFILPELKIFNAFSCDLNNAEISENIAKLIILCIITKDLRNYERAIELNKLLETYNFVIQFDKNASVGLQKSLMLHYPNSEIKNIIREFYNRWDKTDFTYLLNLVIEYFANILKKDGKHLADKSIDDIIFSYDHSIDIYLLTSAFYIDEKISFKNMPGKNDYIDLSHLTYLNGYLNQIVSDDNLLHKIMSRTYPENILKSNEI